MGVPGFRPKRERAEETPKIKVSIKHGDLHYAHTPVLLGHYQADSIVGAERSLDDCLGGKLSERRRLGLYPGPIETAAVVLDDDATPPGAIVVGLGAVGSLSRVELRNTIAKGLVAYSLQVAERRPATDGDSLKVTAMLVGSGTGGVTIENSIEAILEAAVAANRALCGTDIGRLMRIGEVELLELHLDRAVKVSKVLHALANPENRDIRFEISDWRVANGKGGWRRIAYEQDKDWWTRLQITQRDDDQALQFVTLSDRARAEAHMLPTQRASLDAFLQDAVQTTETSSQLSRTLFELLLPNRIKDSMPQARNLVLVVDKKSARYPWELLQDEIATNDGESRSVKPLAVESGMVRQMQTWTFRETVVNTTKLQALVVGDPPTQSFPRLRGAEEEAKAVANQLEKGGFNVQPAIRADFKEILTKLFSHPYRVVHFAGHGVHEFTIEDDDASTHDASKEVAGPSRKKKTVSGMVLGDNVFLTPAEVKQMRVVPELVFINCCHLGAEEGKSSGRDKERFHHLAANLGTQLIEMGARAVVAAGWAVQDQAAKVFAEEFYRQMLVGSSFGVAVKQAREATWDPPSRAQHLGSVSMLWRPRIRPDAEGLQNRGNTPRWTIFPSLMRRSLPSRTLERKRRQRWENS